MKTNIPIKNIYIMLCYAWNILSPDKKNFLDTENFDNIHELLANILINACLSLIKRGLKQEYVSLNDDLRKVRGRININITIKKSLLLKNYINCTYDEFLVDNEYNQIIKTILKSLTYNKFLNEITICKINHILKFFTHVSYTKLSTTLFNKMQFSRNNLHYRQILNICQLIFEGLLVNENKGNIEFETYIKDYKMAKLYEKFVLNFYKRELDENTYEVNSPHINWAIPDNSSAFLISILPQMKTDIVVKNKLNNKFLLIDTKFYSETLISGHRSNAKKLHSNHLYQLNTYLDNVYSDNICKKGLLLYPTINIDVDETIALQDKSIKDEENYKTSFVDNGDGMSISIKL